MLKNNIIKKIGLIICILLVIFIIKVFPKENINTNITFKDVNYNYIYMLDSSNYVSRVKVLYKSTNLNDLILEIIDILSCKSNINNNFKCPINENIKLINYNLINDELILDFNDELNNLDNKSKNKIIESLVYSFTEISDIKYISIKCNNKNLEGYPSKLNRNIKINKEYTLNNINNIKEISLIYIANINNTYYEIPVTKYISTDKEKIDVIIEELKSSTTLNDNLINYINKDLLLQSYNIEDNSFILNFNESIFTGITDDNLLEEIKYVFNESIYENYNINKIFYYDNNNLINSYCFDLGCECK